MHTQWPTSMSLWRVKRGLAEQWKSSSAMSWSSVPDEPMPVDRNSVPTLSLSDDPVCSGRLKGRSRIPDTKACPRSARAWHPGASFPARDSELQVFR